MNPIIAQLPEGFFAIQISTLFLALGVGLFALGVIVFLFLLLFTAGGWKMVKSKYFHQPLAIFFRQEGGAVIDNVKHKKGRRMWHKHFGTLIKLASGGGIRSGISDTQLGVKIATFYTLKGFTIPPEHPLAYQLYEEAGIKGGRQEIDLLNYYISCKQVKPPDKVDITDIVSSDDFKVATPEEQVRLLSAVKTSTGDAFQDMLNDGDNITVFGKTTLTEEAAAVKADNNLPDNLTLAKYLENKLNALPHIEDMPEESLPSSIMGKKGRLGLQKRMKAETSKPSVFWNQSGIHCHAGGLMLDWNTIKAWTWTNVRSELIDDEIKAGIAEGLENMTGLSRWMPIIILIIVGCVGMSFVILALKAAGVL